MHTPRFAAVGAVANATAAAQAETRNYEIDVRIDQNQTAGGFLSTIPVGDTLVVKVQLDSEIGVIPIKSETQTNWSSPDFIQQIEFSWSTGTQLIGPELIAFGTGEVANDRDFTTGSRGVDRLTFSSQIAAESAASDPRRMSVLLETTGTPPVETSLVGIDLPSDQSEVVLSTFDTKQVLITNFLNQTVSGEITAFRVPAPSTVLVAMPAMCIAMRRRR